MSKYLVLFLLMFSVSACSIIGPQQRGISQSLGVVNTTPLQPGVYLWFPVLRGITKMDMLIQKSEVETSAASKDIQEVKTKFVLNWRIDPTRVVEVYQTIGDEDMVLSNVIAPAISEVLKAATAKLTAEEILTKRHELKKEIDIEIKARMVKYNILVDEINITDVQFSNEFAKAVEQKQVAEQHAKRAKYQAEQAEQDAFAEINRAKGQAESQRLVKQSITPELLKLKAIEKWSGNVPQVMGSGTNMLFNIPTGDK